jgi:hypothetical protein
LKKEGYTDFDEFVRDVAQIFYNAKFYNNRGSEIYEDAVTLEVRIFLYYNIDILESIS